MAVKSAQLYRMVMPQHICPYGLKSRDLLRRKGYAVEDHPLRSTQEVDELKRLLDVETTPQTIIDGERIGGYDAVRRFFGLEPADTAGSAYTPVVAIFLTSGLMAAAIVLRYEGTLLSLPGDDEACTPG
ncbi:MAG: glutaredoxin, partial [Halioglobus sp.]|nr:glutaredoxin [Halioglobus sp.]